MKTKPPQPVYTNPDTFAEWWVVVSNMFKGCIRAKRHLIWLWKHDKPIPGIQPHGRGVLEGRPNPFKLKALQELFDKSAPKQPEQDVMEVVASVKGSKWEYLRRQLRLVERKNDCLSKLEAKALLARKKATNGKHD